MNSHFLNSTDLQDGEVREFICASSKIGLEAGCFPPAIETDLGNQEPLHITGPIFDPCGKVLGVAYRQARSGMEVLVLFG
jgi:hypothetical protein